MYEKIEKSDFPYVHRALGAANYVKACYSSVVNYNRFLLPDLYSECIAAGWEEYIKSGDGDRIFESAVRAGKRFIYNEVKISKYDFKLLKRGDEQTAPSVLKIARIIRKVSRGRTYPVSLTKCVLKAYIARERVAGRSFKSIALELGCDISNCLYHYRSVVALVTDSKMKLKGISKKKLGF